MRASSQADETILLCWGTIQTVGYWYPIRGPPFVIAGRRIRRHLPASSGMFWVRVSGYQAAPINWADTLLLLSAAAISSPYEPPLTFWSTPLAPQSCLRAFTASTILGSSTIT